MSSIKEVINNGKVLTRKIFGTRNLTHMFTIMLTTKKLKIYIASTNILYDQ